MKNIAEHKFALMCDKKFGTDLISRFIKLTEEFLELKEALGTYLSKPPKEQSIEVIAHLKEETSDLYAVLTHFASCLDLYQSELLAMATDKIKGREIDPNYKRDVKALK